ncbi:MAG: amidohydrolase family protein [Phycisphaerales bacterium]|nr:amidohydrolase family protein [Phycisphaerales bacterium]
MIRVVLPVAAVAASSFSAPTDDPGPRPNGPFEHRQPCHALVGADVVTAPGTRLDAATIVIRNGMVEAVGTDIKVPADARLWPMEGMVIYPGFVEPAAYVEGPEVDRGPSTHWNERISPELDLRTGGAALDAGERAKFRRGGYCVAATYPKDGILRGTGVVMTTADDGAVDCGGAPAMAAAFERGGWGAGGGPGSLMGSMAMLRQAVSDARWYDEAIAAADRNGLRRPARRDDLAALRAVTAGDRTLMLDARDVKETLRADALARELDLDLIVLGSGDEYRDLPGVTDMNRPFIIPLDYPERPKLESIDAAIRVPLRTLQVWEQAPTNLRRLSDAGVSTCVTTTGLDKPQAVREALGQAIKGGLSEDAALAQITTSPAALLQVDGRVGRIAPGMAAHLVVCDGDLFDDDTSIEETWVSGHREDHTQDPVAALDGIGTIQVGDATADATLDSGSKKLSVTLADGTKAKVKKVGVTGHRVTASLDGRLLDRPDWIRLAGVIRGSAVIGRAVLPDGTVLPMRLDITGEGETTDEDETAESGVEADDADRDPVAGTWVGNIAFGTDFEPPIELTITRDGETVEGAIRLMEQDMPMSNGSYDPATGTLEFTGDGPGGGAFRIVVNVDGENASGTATGPMGEADLSVSRSDDGATGEESEDSEEPEARWTGIPESIPYPLGARGRHAPVTPVNARFEHATIWTLEQAGTISDGCLIVRDGRIAWVGPMDAAPDPDGTEDLVVDATGLHITPGMIDCHSHTGIDGGVNEFNEASTARVGIGDVVAGDDMNWYRQLAGGLTIANQLHGSANPIGGRNSVVKLRWGQPARAFPVASAPAGIKFALGENVKRSSGRYPDSRMGVEAFIRDRLATARHYQAAWDRWNAMSDDERAGEVPPRRDYEFETLSEVLDGDRLIHCHSYRQDEILALLRTCEEFGITIGTLQHILEGYKVADDIARHGAGASSFSDWWAYKIEVMDAIPWNGAIMHDQGVVVSFNSDDSELATRMNDEAAKAVRYGGLPPEEALKFVTLNPARQLGIDDRTGSLAVGKDADFVVWNLHPLDSYSLCMQTWIDGCRYFDREEDATLAARDAADRTRLVQLVLLESLGEPPSPVDDDEPTPAWAANPYLDPADDHRGCCGIPADHVHTGHTGHTGHTEDAR